VSGEVKGSCRHGTRLAAPLKHDVRPVRIAFMNNWITLRRAGGAFDAMAQTWNLATA
jgi:hypothetical protein